MAPILSLSFLLLLAADSGAVSTSAPGGPSARISRASAEDQAREHYKSGLELFEAGDKAQALIEFQLANELAPRAENLAMMGHCEYHLGLFDKARAHYEEYLKHERTGPLAEAARQRIEAMNRRKGLLVIQTVPSGVDVQLEQIVGGQAVLTGKAPNEFPVAAGRWKLTLKKNSYVTQTSEVSIDSVDTKPLFFALEHLPSRLEIHTTPPDATLYVRGNRARNPYIQEVEPGSYEIYAEAPNYEGRSETFILAPGEKRRIDFPLHYVQRSGRPELIGFWTAAGAVAGGTGVLAWLKASGKDPNGAEAVTASATVVTGAALVGGVAGALTSTAFVPGYIRDNLALFRIGTLWIGAVEGSSIALSVRPTLLSGWVGGGAGLTAGAIAGPLLQDAAPNYGRVAVIQSGAAIGALAGALTVPALSPWVKRFETHPAHNTPGAVFVGLNLGLATGLAFAYLPDQRVYGPSWQRVLMTDLAVGAGALAGALIGLMTKCLADTSQECSFKTQSAPSPTATPPSQQGTAAKSNPNPHPASLNAQLALLGGTVGLVAGWLLTSHYDVGKDAPSERTSLSMSLLPMPTVLPVQGRDAEMRMVPGLAAQGRF